MYLTKVIHKLDNYCMSTQQKDLTYKKLTDDGRFREQYRFIFSAAVIATVFIVPNSNVFETILKVALGFSAFFSALYLIATAANVKYNEPGVMYQMLYAGEKFRMRMYDFSVDTFAVAFLYILGLTGVGLIQLMSGVELTPAWQWIILVVIMLIIAILTFLTSNLLKIKEQKNKGELPII